MKSLNASEVDRDSVLETDICIVGSGAAGMAIALQLAGEKKGVLLMESGGEDPDRLTQALTTFESIGDPVRCVNEHRLPSRIRCLGGTTNVWGGRCAALNPIDFRKRDWVPGSGWPISFEDLTPFYSEASKLLQLPVTPQVSLSKREHQLIVQGVLEPVDFLFARRPVNMKSEYASVLQKSANVQVCLNANATEIETDPSQRAVHRIHFRSLSGNAFTVTARTFVLACGGWENARLLLLSRRHSANGIGNDHDVVGRYYMEHPIVREGTIEQSDFVFRASTLLCLRKTTGGYVKQGFRLTDEVQASEKLLNHYVDLVPIYDAPLQGLPYARKGLYELLKPWKSFQSGYGRQLSRGVEFLSAQFLNRPIRSRHLAMINHLEHIPDRNSRVTLGSGKDALGLNRLRVDLHVSPVEKESLIRFHSILRKLLQENDAGELISEFPPADSSWPAMTDAFHHMGTTRMSDTPENGVVDKDCRVHGLSNLFVSGSSVFPTVGCVNPTLSIVALALRLAMRIKSHGGQKN